MKFKNLLTACLYCMIFLFPAIAFAQTGSLHGKVYDAKKSPIGFATVQLAGTQMGSVADVDGNYSITKIPAGNYNVVVSMLGYKKQTLPVTIGTDAVTMDFTMPEDVANLDEVVVVGYGTRVKKDLTGSVSSVSSKEFNKGNVATPEQLITGKVSGLQVISNSGAPGAGSRIRIRGGSSLNASNDPLIVVDGVPLDNTSVNGAANPLGLINPDDIENITILKDASASAIYGSRAANGVILVTTKKGEAGKVKVELSSLTSVSQIVEKVDVLSADEFRKLVQDSGNTTQKNLLGDASTNWQDQIYRTAISSDINVALSGGIPSVPYRLTFGRLDQPGIVKTSNLARNSVGLNLNPTFLEKKLKIDISTKYTNSKFRFSDAGAIGSAVTFDPTQPVYSGTSDYGGYYEWLAVDTTPNILAPRNPLGLLNQKEDISNVNRFIGSAGIDYTMPFMDALRAHVTLGTDIIRSTGTVKVPATAASLFNQSGQNTQYKQDKDNKLLEMYVNYTKEYPTMKSKVDFTLGHSYQDWISSTPAYPSINALGDTLKAAGIPGKTENTLLSFYGRLNYTFADKYLFTFTLRDDGSSRFSPDVRWGLFPSAAFAWRVSDEKFLGGFKKLSNLKLRLGYGITGQQDIVGNDYPYIANYSQGEATAQYQFGNSYYYTLRPDGYDPNIKWEETTAINAGIDFGFYDGRISGTIDYYRKDTKDLLAVVPIAAGTNFTNNLLTNVGTLKNEGLEIGLDVTAVDKKNLTVQFGANFTVFTFTITKLSKIQDDNSIGILTGNIGGGTGNTIQIQSVGQTPFTYYVYEQKYDDAGMPLEGQYVDRNGDGSITPDDRYRYKNALPKMFIGFSTDVTYHNWSAGFSMRASLGNYVYNNVNSQYGTRAYIDGSKKYISNITRDYFDSEFYKTSAVATELLSDYYIEEASFLRMDNISLGYHFKNLFKKNLSLKASFVVQNVFTVTKYTGLDPEVIDGIDNNFYPRPRIYSIGLNFQI